MAKNGGSRSPAPGKTGSKTGSLIFGILIGMVLGMVIAILVAWYLLKSPNPFTSKESREAAKPAVEAAKPAPAKAAPAPAQQGAASGVEESKPRFEFYKVLTDKPDAAAPAQKEGGKAESKAAAKESYLVQAGAFSAAEDADKLKAKLAMLGLEATIQTATVPEKGVMHRVRLGPYKNADEMNKALAMLKQNGIAATPIRAQ